MPILPPLRAPGASTISTCSCVSALKGKGSPSYANSGQEVGNGGLTTEEERAHFSLWAIAKSPLLLGTDLSKISSASLAVISNAGIIALSQDSLGAAATYFQPSGQSAPVSGTLYPYWSGELSDGYVVALVAVSGAETLSVNLADVPGLGSGSYSWKELWTGTTGTGTSVSATLAEHDIVCFPRSWIYLYVPVKNLPRELNI